MMLRYSNSTKRLVATFKRYRNDIDLYTEDERKDKEFYKVLFTRLLNDTEIIINDITPLGCRKNVIERCKNEPNSDRKKLFIVDGDIFLINNTNTENLDNLFVLDSYCIENYLVCENASARFAYTLLGTSPIEEVQNELNFTQWLDEIIEPLVALFFHFSILHQVKGKFKLYNANKYIIKGVLKYDLIEKEIEDIKVEILSVVNQAKYEELFQARQDKWLNNSETLLKIVSGKDYLLPLLQIHIQKLKKSKMLLPNESLKTFLAQYCSLNRLDKLKQKIVSLT